MFESPPRVLTTWKRNPPGRATACGGLTAEKALNGNKVSGNGGRPR